MAGRGGGLTAWTCTGFASAARQANIDAFGVRTVQSFRLSKSRYRPEIGFHADYTTGGGAYARSGDLRTFNYTYGSAPLYSYAFFFSPANMKIFAPTFSISPTHRLRMATEYEMLWRTDSSDAIYAASGVPYRGTAKVSGLRVGRIIRGSIASAAYPGVGLALVAEHLSAGPVLKQADFSDSLFVGPIVNLRF